MTTATTATISGGKQTLVFGARYRVETAKRVLSDATLTARQANGDLVFMDEGETVRLRPASILTLHGSGSGPVADVADRLLDVDTVDPEARRRELVRSIESGHAMPDDFEPDVLVIEPSPALVKAMAETPEGPGYASRLADALAASTSDAPTLADLDAADPGWSRELAEAAAAALAEPTPAKRTRKAKAPTAKSHGAHSKAAKPAKQPARAAVDVQAGYKRCPGVPKRDVAPHAAPVSEFGRKASAKDGLMGTCHSCHKIYAALGRDKRAAAKAVAA